MPVLKHYCEECDSKFSIQYDDREVEDNPQYCCFCSAYIQVDELEQDDDY